MPYCQLIYFANREIVFSHGVNYLSRKERILFFTFYSHLHLQECNIPISKQLHHFKGTFDPA